MGRSRGESTTYDSLRSWSKVLYGYGFTIPLQLHGKHGFTVFVQMPKTARFHRVSNALPSSMPVGPGQSFVSDPPKFRFEISHAFH